MHLQTGHTLQNGKFRITKVLGQGGFGITYLAHHTLLNRDVCIKEFFFKIYCNRDNDTHAVSAATDSGRDMVERYKQKFLKEARTIASLNHPNIVSVSDIFEENGTAYYVMDYIDGPALTDIVKSQGPFSIDEALNCIRQIGNALSYIHSRSINHLDVKPGNIMRRQSDGAYILIDFGLAKQYDAVTGSQTSTTPVGISHGYAPIEQYKAGGVSEFSPQTDVYALGATLYFLITGIVPLDAPELVAATITFPAAIPVHLQQAINRAMQSDKASRPATIADFCALLNPPAPGPAPVPGPKSGPKPGPKPGPVPGPGPSPKPGPGPKPAPGSGPSRAADKTKRTIINVCVGLGALGLLGAGVFALGHFVGKSASEVTIDDEFDYGDDWTDNSPEYNDYDEAEAAPEDSVMPAFEDDSVAWVME